MARDRDLLESCEATFNIEIEPGEAEALRTVGDLYDVIRWKCQSRSLGPSACAITTAYRRLRGQMKAQGINAPIRPTSQLEVLFGPDPRRNWTLLRRSFGKGLPPLALSEGQSLFLIMLMALGLSGGIFGGLFVSDMTGRASLGVLAGLAVLGLTVAMAFGYGLAFGRSIPAGLKTMADLARAAAGREAWSFKSLRRPAALWQSLEDIIKRDAGYEGTVTTDLAVEPARKRAVTD